MVIKLAIFCALLPLVYSDSVQPHINVVTNSLVSRVVGGTDARQGEFPYQVSLQWGLFSFLAKHFCGGAILNEQWILTAGHCILAVPKIGSIVVKAGKLALSKKEATEQSSTVSIAYVHPSYTGGVAPFDIGLLRLKKRLKLNDHVAAIALPPAGNVPTGSAILTGWGSTSNTTLSNSPNILQKVTLPIIDYCTCISAFNALIDSEESEVPLSESNVCTGPLTGGYSACSGDSGGPLVSINEYSGIPEIIGIVSWGVIPCGGGAPSVYTSVSSYIAYITDIISSESIIF